MKHSEKPTATRRRPQIVVVTGIVAAVASIVLILVGIAGVILPALPGLPLVFAGMLLAAWAGDFQQIGWVTLVVLGLLTALSFAVDIFSTTIGAQRVGAGVAEAV